MKAVKINSIILSIAFFTGLVLLQSSCRKDLLNQQPTTQLGTDAFWKTEADATFALMGAYSEVRNCFDRDYYFDGQAEFFRTSGVSASSSNAYNGGNYNPTGYGGSFDKMYRYLYGSVHRTNYVIDNVTNMLPAASSASRVGLEAVIGEARLLRGMVYFRLISMWGDVPYIGHIVHSNDEVALLSRMPIAQVKDSILADFTYAYEKLPAKLPAFGRAAKPAALAFRGKMQLFWASWNKFGWPELDTFKPDGNVAQQAYSDAAADFKKVITDYDLTLFRNGEPGEIDELGKADKLPNYYYLFTPVANLNNPEMIMTFTHGATGTGQGEELMRDFSGRSHEGSQCYVTPRYEIADRYQLTTTGEFAPKLIPMNPTTNSAARTTPNSAVNPASYANRDYRMKSSIQWDYEMSVGFKSLQSIGFLPFIYKTWGGVVTINGSKYFTYDTDRSISGYVFRKFLRNTPGLGRSDGDYAYPVMRLADVYLMYAEASNEVSGPLADAIDLVNKIRHRGNLPPLKADKTADKTTFFDAIEQERIIELFGEGQRSFDLRRWRAIERVWGAPGGNGLFRIDTFGATPARYYQNTSERVYQQNYIFRIPPAERDRNPNLTQNTPWL